MQPDSGPFAKLYEAILQGRDSEAEEVTRAALDQGADPLELVNQYMIPAMDEVGRRFQEQEYFIPELLIAARAMKKSLELLRPLLSERGAEPVGRVVIGTVKGDLHDIGKGLVASMLEGGQFEVIDLGVDVPAEKFISVAVERNANIIALSALLTVTMEAMKDVIEELKKAGLRDRIKVMIGGAPVTQQYADKIGADGYSPDAHGAVQLARSLVGAA